MNFQKFIPVCQSFREGGSMNDLHITVTALFVESYRAPLPVQKIPGNCLKIENV